jgi:aminopeptidase N
MNIISTILFALGLSVQTGVPAQLAQHRAKVLSNIHYTLNFTIPEDQNAAVQATEVLDFKLSNKTEALQLDFKTNTITRVNVNGKDVKPNFINEHLVIAAKNLVKGANNIKLSYTTVSSSMNRNRDYMYTLLVPDRARTVFPCFDQPDLKARYTLTLNVPKDWQAVGNAPVKDSVINDGVKTVNFTQSDLVSTYLFSFVAGKFYKVTKGNMNLYHRETDTAKLKASIDPIFDIQADAMNFMEEYTNIKYPFKKFDCIAIPDFQYGGMEHVGAIQYKAAALFLDTSATRDQLIARANVLAHETAHQWFGDLVTMRWFNDVWMKEVFANFMADKIGNVTLKDNNYALKFLTDHYPLAYGVDRTPGANPIRQQLDNLQDAGSMYGNIIYHKAPIMMRQLERLMGEKAFQQGLRQYLKKYAYSNATWPDLISILDALTPADLVAWNKVWVNQPGRLKFSHQLKIANGKIIGLNISQQGEDGSKRFWPQYFELAFIYKDRIETIPVNMKASSVIVAAGKAVPDAIVFNSSGDGYGVFPVDAAADITSLSNPVTRASGYINLYENMLSGKNTTPQKMLSFVQDAILKEKEELNLNILADYIGAIFWRFMPADKRVGMAAQVENTLWQAMEQASTPNTKKLLFKAYCGIALSKAAQDKVFDIWKQKQAPAGVTLVEEDYTSLATGLAVRNYTDYQSILNEQLTRIQNTDRKDRLKFLMPSLSNDVAVRDAFFASLKDKANRAKESWVAMALGNMHHPLRAAQSEKYLPESLDWLADIQRTGDIFFPQAWLQSSFNWYQTPTAAAVVSKFLKDNPNYNPKLKAKILQSTDNLFRAVKLVK